MRVPLLVPQFSWLGYCCAILVGLVAAAVLVVSFLAVGAEDNSDITDLLTAILPLVLLIFPGAFIMLLIPTFFGLFLIRKMDVRSRLISAVCGACVASAPVFIVTLIILTSSSEISEGILTDLMALVVMAACSGSIAAIVYRGIASQENLKN